jgi:predicted transglutaminase-like cysteine proteinase
MSASKTNTQVETECTQREPQPAQKPQHTSAGARIPTCVVIPGQAITPVAARCVNTNGIGTAHISAGRFTLIHVCKKQKKIKKINQSINQSINQGSDYSKGGRMI